MASVLTAYPTRYKAASAVRNVRVSFDGWLLPQEIITGTPTVAVSPSGPTLSAASVSTTPMLVNGKTVPAGKVVLFTVSAGTAGVSYVITVTGVSSGSETLIGYLNLEVASS